MKRYVNFVGEKIKSIKNKISCVILQFKLNFKIFNIKDYNLLLAVN